jgi:N-acetylmuramoyl-L-alanine amidase
MTELDVLGLTIIGEARGEPVEGQVAVGSVIRNRLHIYPNKYKSYSEVCLEKDQFSCWTQEKDYLNSLYSRMMSGPPITDIYIVQCQWVAQGIFYWRIVDNTKSSCFYMTKELFSTNRPKWAAVPKSDPIDIGSQVFFNV